MGSTFLDTAHCLFIRNAQEIKDLGGKMKTIKRSPILVLVSLVLTVIVFTSPVLAVEWEAPPTYTVAGVVGASYENGRTAPTHPMAPNSWYIGGHYKTWVDFIAAYQDKDYHWLNYARGGEVSVNGVNQLMELLIQTTWPDATGQPVSHLEVLVIGNWGNDFAWLPAYDQQVMDALVQNVNDQIALAKSFGVKKIIVTGWTEWEDIDFGYFISLFPDFLPFHIDEAGYNQAKQYYYDAFNHPDPDYLFVEQWCKFGTFDGVHPGIKAAKMGANRIAMALKLYDELIGVNTLLCQ